MNRKIINKVKVVALHFSQMGVWNAIKYISLRLTSNKDAVIQAHLKKSDLTINLRNNKYDTQIFTQIFLREELKINLQPLPKVIIDGGANIGLSTLYLKDRYPFAKIISIEPEPSNFELLLLNTKSIANVTCIQKGLWNSNCKLNIIDTGNGNSSFRTEMSEGEALITSIDAITISTIMKQFDISYIDLLKLDIEGSEKNLFEADFQNWLSKTNHIVVEIHPYINPDGETTILKAVSIDFNRSEVGEYSYFRKKTLT